MMPLDKAKERFESATHIAQYGTEKIKQAVFISDEAFLGRDATINTGRYKGRRVRIKCTFYWEGELLFEVQVYSLLPMAFHKFIDQRSRKDGRYYYRFEELEFVEESS